MLTKQCLSQKDLSKIIKLYDIGKIIKVKPLLTSGNIAYIVETLKNKYVLRLCPAGVRSRSRSEIIAEVELIRYLLKNNFSAARPISDKFGNIAISLKNHNGYLREFMDGREKINPSLEEIKIFGNLLGRFHRLTENYRTKNKRKHIFDPRETKKYFEKNKKLICNDGQKGELFSKIFSDEINQIKLSKNLPSGTIHEDLGKRHVLWRGNKIVGIIDFDRCYFGHLILDLGEACRGWCFKRNWKLWDNNSLKALLVGYCRKRRLKKIERDCLFDAIKFAVLEKAISFYTRYLFVTHDAKDRKYALHSVGTDGLLGLLTKNKRDILKIIKAA